VVFSPTAPSTALRGFAFVSYSATDQGSGIASAALIVDGVELARNFDSNGGKCQQPYQFLEPCRLNVSASLALDTTELGDGPHQLQVAVEDAAGQRTVSAAALFNVRNAPTNTGRPVITGVAKVGGQLSVTTGTWAGNPTAFAYQWLRCPASIDPAAGTAGCATIAGAEGAQYAPDAADVNQRDVVSVTATNPSGSETAASALSELIDPIDSPPKEGGSGGGPKGSSAPVLTHVSLSRKLLRIEKSATAKASKTLLRFSSSKKGQLTIVIARLRGRGHPKRVALLAAPIKAGLSVVPLGTMIGTKQLSPGRYQVTISVRDAAKNNSKEVSRSFTVVRG
jgi:hypothetical protein